MWRVMVVLSTLVAVAAGAQPDDSPAIPLGITLGANEETELTL